jgi:amino-acid N-acetyltransferase
MELQDRSAPPSAPRIRSATRADLPNINALLTKSELPLDGVEDVIDNFVVADVDGAIVGVAALECCLENGLLRSVAVEPEWRSRGVARQLVMRVISDAESRGFPALYLLTMSAEQYFPRFGFERVVRDGVPADIRGNAQFTTMCPSSAVVMRRSLAETPNTA